MLPVVFGLALAVRMGTFDWGPEATPTATITLTQVSADQPTPTPYRPSPPTSVPRAVTPTATPTSTPEPTVTSTPTVAPSSTPRPAPTVTATATPEPPASPTPELPEASPTLPVARPWLIAIDPGHGGEYAGAVHYDASGHPDLVEKDVNLRVARLLADMLEKGGYRVVMTRSGDTIVNTSRQDLNGDGELTVEDDLQARVDLINESQADLLLSIHHNASGSTPMRGCMTYYCGDRPFADRNRTLANLLQDSLLARLRSAGYAAIPDLGVRDDSTIGKPHGHLCLTGPTTPVLARASAMPGVVGEALFVSDDHEAALLNDDEILLAIAAAYKDAVDSYVEVHQ